VESDYPAIYMKISENLGEVHSDHLQILAEKGFSDTVQCFLPVVALGSRSWIFAKRMTSWTRVRGFVPSLLFRSPSVSKRLPRQDPVGVECRDDSAAVLSLRCMFRWSHDATAA